QAASCLVTGLGNLSRALVGLGHLERARGAAQECMRLAMGGGASSRCACSLEPAVGLAVALGEHDRAVRFFSAAEANRHQLHLLREPADEGFIAPLVARAREALGEARYAAAFDSGLRMPFMDMFAEALHWLERAAH
ncbi:MAG TPA: hypothetical protein VFV25_07730, partial [Methylibium sp.]